MSYLPQVTIPTKIAVAVAVVAGLGFCATGWPGLRWPCVVAGGALAFWAGVQAGKLREWNRRKPPPGA